MTVATGLTLLAAILAMAGAGTDIMWRRLPNWLCGVFALIAASALVASAGLSELPMAVLHGLLALIVGMALFAMGWIGGGDAKFYAAAAMGTQFEEGLRLLLLSSISGLVLLILFMIGKYVLKLKSLSDNGLNPSAGMVPYGVAIAFGFVLLKYDYGSTWLQ